MPDGWWTSSPGRRCRQPSSRRAASRQRRPAGHRSPRPHGCAADTRSPAPAAGTPQAKRSLGDRAAQADQLAPAVALEEALAQIARRIGLAPGEGFGRGDDLVDQRPGLPPRPSAGVWLEPAQHRQGPGLDHPAAQRRAPANRPGTRPAPAGRSRPKQRPRRQPASRSATITAALSGSRRCGPGSRRRSRRPTAAELSSHSPSRGVSARRPRSRSAGVQAPYPVLVRPASRPATASRATGLADDAEGPAAQQLDDPRQGRPQDHVLPDHGEAGLEHNGRPPSPPARGGGRAGASPRPAGRASPRPGRRRSSAGTDRRADAPPAAAVRPALGPRSTCPPPADAGDDEDVGQIGFGRHGGQLFGSLSWMLDRP